MKVTLSLFCQFTQNEIHFFVYDIEMLFFLFTQMIIINIELIHFVVVIMNLF
jgi:hypothetical protein